MKVYLAQVVLYMENKKKCIQKVRLSVFDESFCILKTKETVPWEGHPRMKQKEKGDFPSILLLYALRLHAEAFFFYFML